MLVPALRRDADLRCDGTERLDNALLTSLLASRDVLCYMQRVDY